MSPFSLSRPPATICARFCTSPLLTSALPLSRRGKGKGVVKSFELQAALSRKEYRKMLKMESMIQYQ